MNSVITGNNINNTWKYGGGIANSGTLNLYFSTIADNYAYDGGGLNAGSIENIYNSIIWGNDIDGSQSNPEIRGAANTLYLTEIAADPSFVLRSTATKTIPQSDGDYRLTCPDPGTTCSNCVDTGDETNKPIGDDDIIGTVRPVDIGSIGDGSNDYDKGAV